VFVFQGEDKKKEEKDLEEAELEKLRKIKDTNKLEDKELLVKMCKCKLVTQPSLPDYPALPPDNIKNNQEKGASAYASLLSYCWAIRRMIGNRCGQSSRRH
jgi:hypothetical protein